MWNSKHINRLHARKYSLQNLKPQHLGNTVTNWKIYFHIYSKRLNAYHYTKETTNVTKKKNGYMKGRRLLRMLNGHGTLETAAVFLHQELIRRFFAFISWKHEWFLEAFIICTFLSPPHLTSLPFITLCYFLRIFKSSFVIIVDYRV